jgi:hypothetical protein
MKDDNVNSDDVASSDEQFERYIAGEMSAEECVAFEEEIIGTHALSDKLYADMSLVVALESAAQARRERQARAAQEAPRWYRQPLRWAVPLALAASLAILVIGRSPSGPEVPAVFRNASEAPVVLAPVGDIATSPRLFTWRYKASIAHYRFELFDPAATVLFSYVTADTSLALDPLAVEIPDKGFWVLTPLDDLHLQAGSEVTTWYQVTP